MPTPDDMSERLEKLLRQVEGNPESPEFVELARLLLAAGRHGEAVSLCERRLGFHPDLAAGHLVYGQALVATGRLEDGLQALERACALEPHNADLVAEAGIFLHQQGHAAAAGPYLEKALDLGHDDPQLATLLAGNALGNDGALATDPSARSEVEDTLRQQPDNQPQTQQGSDEDGESETVAAWPDWQSRPPPPKDALAPDEPEATGNSNQMASLDDEDDEDEPPTVYAPNPLAGAAASSPAAEVSAPGGEAASAADETVFDPSAGMRAEIDHAVEQAVQNRKQEPPTMFDPGAASEPHPWAGEPTGEPPRAEPPTMFGGTQAEPAAEPPPTRFVTSPDGAVQPFKEAVAAPAEPLNYFRVFLVLVPFLVAGLALGGYFAFSHLRAEKIANFLEQARGSLELDTMLGYSEARLTLQKLLEYDESNAQGLALLALVDARLHHEYGPNLGLAEEATRLLEQLPADEVEPAWLLWTRYYLGQRQGLAEAVAQARQRSSGEAAVWLQLLAARLAADGGDRAAALDALGKALESQPANLPALYLRARLLRQEGRLEQAQQVLEKLLSINGMHVQGLLELAELRLQRGTQQREARRDLERVVEIPRVNNRRRARAHYLLAKLAFADFDRDRGLAGVRAARSLVPDDEELALALAKLCLQANELDEADELAERVLKKQPDSIPALMVQAAVALQRRRAPEAMKKLEALLGKRVPAAPFLLLRGRTLLELGRYQAALRDFEAVPAGKPERRQADSWAALALLRGGEEKAARSAVRRLLRADGRLALAHYVLGEIYLARGLAKAARTSFRRAAKLDGRCFPAFERLAEMALERNQVDSALANARLALRAHPFDVRAALLVGRALLRKGEAQAAHEAFSQALLLEPGQAEGFWGLAEAQLLLGQAAQAEQSALKALQRGLREARVYHVLGRARLAQARFGKAAWALGQAARLDENDPEIQADLGLAYLGLRSLRRAQAAFEKALRRRRLARAQEGLAQVYKARGRWEDAARAFQKAAGWGRREGWPKSRQAELYMESGRAWIDARRAPNNLARARRAFAKAVALAPDQAEPLYLLATAYDRDDKLAAARANYLKALAVDPQHADSLYRLGLLEFDQRNDRKAAEYLRRFVDLKPPRHRSQLARARRLLRRLKQAGK